MPEEEKNMNETKKKTVIAPYCLEPLPEKLINQITEHFDEIFNDETEEDIDL